MTDNDMFRKAAAKSRVLLTFDLDFGKILALSRERTVSVVLFRLHNTRTPHVVERLKVTLEETKQMLESGAVVVVEDGRLRGAAASIATVKEGNWQLAATSWQRGARFPTSSDYLHRTFRERLHERAPVGPSHDPVVEDDDDAAIAFCSDEVANALSKFQDRFRERIFRERIAAALLH